MAETDVRRIYISSLKLFVPSIEELSYRKKLLSDPETMDYNKGLKLEFKGYDNKTGCIDFKKSKWDDWHNGWINREPDRYYAYLVEKNNNCPIGEVAIRFDKEKITHIISIIIEAKHQGKGYGSEGLKLLLEKAFFEFGLEKVTDEFPESRIAAVKLFKDFGFKVVEKNNKNILLELKLERYLEYRS